MEKKLALFLADQIREIEESARYDVTEMPFDGHALQNFHQWTNGKPLAAGFLAGKTGEESYYLLLIDWHRNDNYYLVVYMHDKSTTVCEIQTISKDENGEFLVWKYNPLKRDGKNQLRKSYFQQRNGSVYVKLPLPQSPADAETFLDKLFILCRNRLQADKSPAIFDEI